MPKSEQELLKRDAERDIGAELLQSVREMKSGQKGRVTQIHASWISQVRLKKDLSQAEFAELLGVSVRTLQDWEQGRREPSGAAKTLLKIADRHPDVLTELAA
jgi:putative transcriptional regulator